MSTETASAMSVHDSLATLFNPRSVAVVGASTNPDKLSGIPLRNLKNCGYTGDLYVVNPRVDEIAGIRSYPSISAIGVPVDVVFIVLPAERAVAAAREAAACGTQVAVIGVSGFAESGEPRGKELQDQLGQIVADTGMRIVGPNTNGLYNATDKLSLGYNSAHADVIDSGPISIVSHSGAMLSIFARRLRASGVGLSKFIAVGNESDLDMLDYVDYLVDDPDTETIALLMEAIDDGARFKHLARRAAANGKRIVVVKLGQSEEGAQATAAHSSRLAGSARSYEAMFAQAGVASVSTPEALITAAALTSKTGTTTPVGSSLGIITYSGAASSIAADAAAALGIPLAKYSPETLTALEAVPRWAPITNPLDIGGVGGVDFAEQTFTAVSLDADVRLVLIYAHIQQTPVQRRAMFEALRAAQAASRKPHVVLAPGGLTDDEIEWLQSIDVLYLTETAVCFTSLAAHWRWSDYQVTTPDDMPATGTRILELLETHTSGAILTEHDSLQVLDAAGIRTVERRFCSTLDDLASAAGDIGYPLVLKAVVNGVAHKSDLGLVELGITSGDDLQTAADRLRHNPAAAAAEGFLLGRMLSSDLEVIAGVTDEPGLGMFLVFGVGGVLAEVIDSVTLVPLPASRSQIEHDLAISRVGQLLSSERWRHPETKTNLLNTLTNLAHLVRCAGDRIAAIDINPVLVHGNDVTAVDALIVLSD